MNAVGRYTPADRVSALLLENAMLRGGQLDLGIQRGEVENATIQTRFGGCTV
jgi:hypothetical protein